MRPKITSYSPQIIVMRRAEIGDKTGDKMDDVLPLHIRIATSHLIRIVTSSILFFFFPPSFGIMKLESSKLNIQLIIRSVQTMAFKTTERVLHNFFLLIPEHCCLFKLFFSIYNLHDFVNTNYYFQKQSYLQFYITLNDV